MQTFNVPDEFQEKFQKMWEVGQLTKLCLDELGYLIKPGFKSIEIDRFVRFFANKQKLQLAQEGYRGFPAACCVSPNHVICHGIPNNKTLKEGDIVKVDVTFIKDGYYGDSCRTYLVGETSWGNEISVKAQHAFECAKNALGIGISQAIPGNTIRDISKTIQNYVEWCGHSVVRDFCSHGIGTEFHTWPSIPHYIAEEECHQYDTVLIPGMTFTIEPMIALGKPDYKILKDEWTVVTRDRSLSAQFEHTIGITNDGNVIFTQ